MAMSAANAASLTSISSPVSGVGNGPTHLALSMTASDLPLG